MASETPPAAYSPKAKGDDEVLSNRTFTGRGEAQEAPEGEAPIAGHQGDPIPWETGEEGCAEFGPQPYLIPEADTALESGRQPSSAGGGAPVPPATSVQPEVPDTLSAALKSASIVEEHRDLMGGVIEKIQSAESGLNGACISLITGFEVCCEVSKSVVV